MLKNFKAQVWIETVIYILISLIIISILLSIAVPQIEKIKDQSIVEQTITAMNLLNNKILEVEESQGNIGIFNLKLSKGKLILNAETDTIEYLLENTRLELSEPGKKIKEGDIILETQNYGKKFNIILSMNYSRKIDMTYNKENKNRVLQPGTAPYKIQIENIGYNEAKQKTDLDFDIL